MIKRRPKARVLLSSVNVFVLPGAPGKTAQVILHTVTKLPVLHQTFT